MQKLSETSVSGKGPVLVYPVAGSFTAKQAIGLKEEISRRIDAAIPKIVLDMTAVTETDIVGVNTLVQILLSVRRGGSDLEVRLIRDSPLDKILRLTKFHRHFNLVFPF